MQEDSVYKCMRKYGAITLVDHFDYANKAVGLGVDNTHMETLVFSV